MNDQTNTPKFQRRFSVRFSENKKASNNQLDKSIDNKFEETVNSSFDYIETNRENVENSLKIKTRTKSVNDQAKKRKLFDLSNEQSSKVAKKELVISKDQFKYVFIDLQLTGYLKNSNIVKLTVYDLSNETGFSNFIFPFNNYDRVASEMNDIEIDGRIMLDGDQIVKYKNLQVALNEFIDFLESYGDDQIVLVYENKFDIEYIPHILINNLRRVDLFDKIKNLVAGFIDCDKLFGVDGKFNLETEAKNLKIKSDFNKKHPLYRIDLLSKYFDSEYFNEKNNQMKNFEDIQNEMVKYYDEEDKLSDQSNHTKDSLEQILEEARIMNETKEYLTGDELRNLYLMQKHKYQYIHSKTYKPKKKFPKTEPKKKST